MKRKCPLIVVLLLMFFTLRTSAANKLNKVSPANDVLEMQDQARLKQMQLRVQEIKAMDKSQLTHSERKALRQELYQIKSQAKGMTSGGVYLSAAAIIIIVLVLILII